MSPAQAAAWPASTESHRYKNQQKAVPAKTEGSRKKKIGGSQQSQEVKDQDEQWRVVYSQTRIVGEPRRIPIAQPEMPGLVSIQKRRPRQPQPPEQADCHERCRHQISMFPKK